MDKATKIRRYQRKDYTAVVEFPVEIIGRDGLVRKYSFEESIRLYQRRIASADLRYSDLDLVQAEKQHCQSRIDQLRRSFFAHHGWPAVEIVDSKNGPPGILAAEVAAFLRRVLGAVAPQPERLAFSLLESTGDYRVYFVQPPCDDLQDDSPIDGHFLLYVFQFQSIGASADREAFFDMVKVLDGVKITGAQSVESMIAFFHTHDCGLILTGRGSLAKIIGAEGNASSEELAWAPDPHAPDPVETGMRLLSSGRLEEALDQFVFAYTEQHFRRVAYLGAAAVADQLGIDEEVETATVMGCRYFPNDPALEYFRGVNLMRRERFESALQVFDGLRHWKHGEHVVSLMAGLCMLGLHRLRAARHQFRGLDSRAFHTDPHLGNTIRWIRAQQWARDVLFIASVLLGVLGLCSVVFQISNWGLLPAVFGFALSRMVMVSWHRQLIKQISGPSDQRLRLSSSAILMDAPRGGHTQ